NISPNLIKGGSQRRATTRSHSGRYHSTLVGRQSPLLTRSSHRGDVLQRKKGGLARPPCEPIFYAANAAHPMSVTSQVATAINAIVRRGPAPPSFQDPD